MVTDTFKQIVDSDIDKCKEVLKYPNINAWKDLYRVLLSKYSAYIAGFSDYLYSVMYDNNGQNYKKNIEVMCQKLELFRATNYQDFSIPNKKSFSDKSDKSTTIAPIQRSFSTASNSNLTSNSTNKQIAPSKVFIVHGHENSIKEAVARIIEKQGIKAIILHEQVKPGATIIEKIEAFSDVGAAICLFTPDDIGREKNNLDEKKRGRQNVVFEAGYFMGKLGRDNVIILSSNDIELPSDLQGIEYTETGEWQIKVLRALKKIGFKIDLNLLDD